MKRRLIQQGLGGFTVTLPIQWVREYNLTAGSEVDVTENPEGVLISAQLTKREKSISLDVSSYDNSLMITNLLNHAYRLGYDIIKLKYSSEKQYSEIVKITSTLLLGFEVVRNQKHECILQNIAEPDAEKFEVMLRKFFLICKEQSEFLSNLDQVNLQQLNEYKLQNDRLANYLRRTLIRSRVSGETSFLVYLIVGNVSYVNHALFYLFNYLKTCKKVPSKETRNLCNKTKELYSLFYQAFYNKDYSFLDTLGKDKLHLDASINLLLEKGKGPDNIILCYLKEASRMVQLCVPPTLGVIIQSTNIDPKKQ